MNHSRVAPCSAFHQGSRIRWAPARKLSRPATSTATADQTSRWQSAALTGSVDVLLGNADGTFQTAQNSAAAFGIRSLAAGDLDADGTVDLVTANSGTVFAAGSMSLLFGNGDGTFQPPVNSPFGDNPISVAMGDLDGDGDLDIVETTKVYSYTEPVFKVRVYDYYVAVFLNDLDPINHYANLNFAHSYYLNSGDFSRLPDSIRIADINGHPSVVFTSLESNIVRVMLGNSTGALQSPISFSTGTSPRSVAVGDINGDGIVDLVTANSGSNDVSVLLGTGSGIPLFQSAVSYAAGTNPVSVALAEINGDGRLDIVVANSGSDNVSVLLGNGNGTFQTALNYAAGSGPVAVAAGNFNGDSSPSGRPYNDLAVANSTSNAVSVLLNAADWVLPTTVAGRHIFYNQSACDGASAAAGLPIDFVSDELARAPDKTAYLPGDPTAVAFNITNYSRGITGIMIDLSTTGGSHSSITASDFVFKVGNNNTPSSWAAAPAPTSVAVSLGGGVGGSDRVEITWSSTISIKNAWLEVQVLANANTGLACDRRLLLGQQDRRSGHRHAECHQLHHQHHRRGPGVCHARLGAGATITDLRDYNRDKGVNTTDAAIVFANLGNLNRLNVGAGPFAPEGAAVVAAATARAMRASRAPWPADPAAVPPARLRARPCRPRSRSGWVAAAAPPAVRRSTRPWPVRPPTRAIRTTTADRTRRAVGFAGGGNVCALDQPCPHLRLVSL